MPELPEVETIRRGLERTVVGKTVVGIEVKLKKLFHGEPLTIIGCRIEAIRRYGKGLVIDFSGGHSLTIHVKMTGQFLYIGPETIKSFHPTLSLPQALPSKHTHVVFDLVSKEGLKATLYYNDIRQFGWLKVVETDRVSKEPFFKSLGPEPFSTLTQEKFYTIVSSSKMPIKSLLMNQMKVSGIGNIYANDSLYAAKIDPRRSSSSLSVEESDKLFKAILEVLEKGIRYGGASEINYVNIEGGKGEYQNHFLVYGKSGQACAACGSIIQRIRQSGRSSFFCPVCQK